jgi:hypothetical protein
MQEHWNLCLKAQIVDFAAGRTSRQRQSRFRFYLTIRHPEAGHQLAMWNFSRW